MSSVQVTITQLPTAGPITGTESVPIVQNGQTVQTTTAAIAASPSQTQSFLTVDQEPTLTNSQYLSTGTGLGLQDGGPQSYLRIVLNGASGSLETSPNGIIVKTSSNTVTARTLQTTGDGLAVSNGNGQSGNPTFSLTGVAASVAGLSGSGLVAVRSGATVTPVSIAGTANEIDVANGNAFSGNPTIGLADNPTIPGSAGTVLPSGNTAARPVSVSNGTLRYNTDLALFEGYANNAWGSIATGGGVTSVGTGTGLTGGPITSTGTISIDNTVVATLTDSQTLTNKTMSGLSNTFSNIGNSSLTNSSITINGSSVSLGGSTTVTATATNALTIGTGLSGTSYDGSTAVTIAIDSTVATLSDLQTLTNKTISGSSNTLSNIGNSSLTNSSITLGTTTTSLGATSLTLGGLTSVTVTQDPTAALDLATKQYVDSVAQGLNVKQAVLWGTTGNILLTGLTTQAGGEWTGTLTAGDRILVKNQLTAAENGIYSASALGWTRTSDANAWDELVSAFVFVEDGATLADTGWVCTVNPGGTLGVTAVTWSQFSGAGTYSAGTGLTLTGTQFSLTAPVTAALGGTGSTSYTTGDMLYASGSTAISKLGIGTSTYIMTSSGSAPQWSNPTGVSVGSATNLAGGTTGAMPYQTGTGATSFLSLGTANYVLTAGASAPQYVAQSTLSVGSATNATNTEITANTTNANYYLTFVSATTGNLPQLVNSSVTVNPSTGKLTGGIAGGAF